MVELFILMMERVGLIILLAFLLVNVPYFKRVLLSREKMSSKVQLILIFGLFAIISNFTGIEIAKNQIVPNNLLTYLSKECFHCEYAYVSNWRFWISRWSDCRQYGWFNCWLSSGYSRRGA